MGVKPVSRRKRTIGGKLGFKTPTGTVKRRRKNDSEVVKYLKSTLNSLKMRDDNDPMTKNMTNNLTKIVQSSKDDREVATTVRALTPALWNKFKSSSPEDPNSPDDSSISEELLTSMKKPSFNKIINHFVRNLPPQPNFDDIVITPKKSPLPKTPVTKKDKKEKKIQEFLWNRIQEIHKKHESKKSQQAEPGGAGDPETSSDDGLGLGLPPLPKIQPPPIPTSQPPPMPDEEQPPPLPRSQPPSLPIAPVVRPVTPPVIPSAPPLIPPTPPVVPQPAVMFPQPDVIPPPRVEPRIPQYEPHVPIHYAHEAPERGIRDRIVDTVSNGLATVGSAVGGVGATISAGVGGALGGPVGAAAGAYAGRVADNIVVGLGTDLVRSGINRVVDYMTPMNELAEARGQIAAPNPQVEAKDYDDWAGEGVNDRDRSHYAYYYGSGGRGGGRGGRGGRSGGRGGGGGRGGYAFNDDRGYYRGPRGDGPRGPRGDYEPINQAQTNTDNPVPGDPETGEKDPFKAKSTKSAYEEPDVLYSEKYGDALSGPNSERVPGEPTLRPRYGIAGPASVIPSKRDQLKSDVQFDMFSVVQPGFGQGVDNKIFLHNLARDAKIRYTGKMYGPGPYIGPLGGVNPMPWQWQPVKSEAHMDTVPKRELQTLRNEKKLLSAVGQGTALALPSDTGLNSSTSSSELPRPSNIPLEPIIRNDGKWEPVSDPAGVHTNQRTYRPLYDPLRNPRSLSISPENGGPTMSKRSSLQVILP